MYWVHGPIIDKKRQVGQDGLDNTDMGTPIRTLIFLWESGLGFLCLYTYNLAKEPAILDVYNQ